MKKQKNIIIALLTIGILCTSNHANAQMGEAQTITYDVDTRVQLNMSQSKAWNMVKDLAHWNVFSNGFVRSIEILENAPQEVVRKIIYADGTFAKDVITQPQSQSEHFFIMREMKEPLPAGIKGNIISVHVDSLSANTCKAGYAIFVQGTPEAKQTFLKSLKIEMNAYLTGLGMLSNK